MHSFAVYYIEANIVCIIVFGIMLAHNYRNIDRQEKQVKFDHVLNAFMAYFLIDCFWALITANIIPETRFTVVLNVFLIYIAMSAITYTWLEYVMAYEQVPNRDRPVHRFAVVFPFLISTIALILHYIIAPDMLINESLDTIGAYNVYLVIVPYIYMAAILFYTIRKARAEENKIEKRTISCNGRSNGNFPKGKTNRFYQRTKIIRCFVKRIAMKYNFFVTTDFEKTLKRLCKNTGRLLTI